MVRVGCLLAVVRCWFLVAYCLSVVDCYWFCSSYLLSCGVGGSLIVGCCLFVLRCVLLVVCCGLFVVWCVVCVLCVAR